MTNRYEVRALPFPLFPLSKHTECWAVVDLRPECELVENFMGKLILESRRPPYRQIAWATQLQHAVGVCDAMNKTEDERHAAQQKIAS